MTVVRPLIRGGGATRYSRTCERVCYLYEEETGLVERRTGYRLWLKLRVGKTLATEETSLTASVAGREVTTEC